MDLFLQYKLVTSKHCRVFLLVVLPYYHWHYSLALRDDIGTDAYFATLTLSAACYKFLPLLTRVSVELQMIEIL